MWFNEKLLDEDALRRLAAEYEEYFEKRERLKINGSRGKYTTKI